MDRLISFIEQLISRLIALKPLGVVGLFILLDIICIGMGMGVPFFCILLGLPVGWFAVRYIIARTTRMHEVLRKVLLYALIASVITLLGMCIILLPMSTMLYDPGNDLSTTGVPLILYEPRASFIGWLVLMILVSPAIQLLSMHFGSHLTILVWLDKTDAPRKR